MRWGSVLRQVMASALALGSVLLVGCTGGDGSTADPRAAPDGAAVASARQRIEGSDLTDPASLTAVDEIRFTLEGAAAAREVLDSEATGDARWAAVWVYGASGTDPAPLLAVLEDEDPSIRVMAAASVVARGEPSGFEVLVAELENVDLLEGSEPPVAVWEFALTSLERYTQEPPTSVPAQATKRDLAAAHDAWAAWLQAQGTALSYDGDAGTWSTV